MAISISACIRPPSSPLTAKKSMSKELNWRSQCVSIAAASAVIGSMVLLGGDSSGVVLAAGDEVRFVEGSSAQGKGVMRWSDKRKCQPWRQNSLENIMPENLPRLTDRQRSNRVAAYRTAPAVMGSIRLENGCYSL